MLPEKCSVCGGKLQYRRQESVQGWHCTRCDWSVVTTYIPEIDLDETVYDLSVSRADPQSLLQIRAIAEVSTISFLDAKKLLNEAHPLVMRGNARKVLAARTKLSGVGLKVHVTPEFIYAASDLTDRD